MRLFCYGTLQFPEVMEAVTGGHFLSCPARLNDYACRTVRGQVFPGIIHSQGSSTGGVMYAGLDRAQLSALDRFETDLYERIRVYVTDPGGVLAQAWTYAIPTGMKSCLSSTQWDPLNFERFHLASFLRICQTQGAWRV